MTESLVEPITVAIERSIDPDRVIEATSWMQAGTDMAATFPGFLGSGWVRAGEDSDLWYMLYRFRDMATLEAWERSPQRTWWLDSGRPFAREVRVERRTGIEGWFDAGVATLLETRTVGTAPITQPIPVAPPRWKQTITIWLGFFPVNLLATFLLSFWEPFGELPMVVRVFCMTAMLTPIMTYLMLPTVTRLLQPWLQKRR